MEQLINAFREFSVGIYILGPVSICVAIILRWSYNAFVAAEKYKYVPGTPHGFSLKFFWLENRPVILLSWLVATILGFVVIFFYGVIQMFIDYPLPEEPTAGLLFVVGLFWKEVASRLINSKLAQTDRAETMRKISKDKGPVEEPFENP